MTEKMIIGRTCEYLVKVLIETKTGCSVTNENDRKNNHPTTDLHVTCPSGDYSVSVKAKYGPSWPAVHGIKSENQYIVFVDLQPDVDPTFYVLNHPQWTEVLKEILPNRKAIYPGAKIVDGAIEFHWTDDNGMPKKRRGSALGVNEIPLEYKNAWAVLPGAKSDI